MKQIPLSCLIAAVLTASAPFPSSGAGAPPASGRTVGERAPAPPARLATKALLLDATHAGDRIVAVGAHGIIIHSDDGGGAWKQASVPVQSLLTGVSFADDARGWAVGHEGIVLRTEDAGANWTLVTTPLHADDSLLEVIALGPLRALLAGAYGVFLKTDDDGTSWSHREPVVEDMHINRISRGPSGTLLLAGEAGMLALSENGGEDWRQLESPYEGSFYGLHELASGRLLAHGLRGHVHVSDDRGASWSRSSVEREVLIMAAAEPRPGTVVAGGLGGVVFVSRDNADTFRAVELRQLKACAELLPTASGAILALGEGGVELLDPGLAASSQP